MLSFATGTLFVGFALSLIFVLLRTFQAKRAGQTLSRSIYAWCIAFVAIQAFLFIWSCRGLVNLNADNPETNIVAATLLISACVAATLWHDQIFKLNEGKKIFDQSAHPVRVAVVLLIVAGFFAMLGLEISSNHDLFNFEWVYPLCVALEWWLLTMLMLGLFFVSGRRGIAPAILVLGVCILGIAEYFLLTFKNMPIQPGDLSALSTAAAVSGTYVYEITPYCLMSIAFASIALLLCQWAGAISPKRTKGDRKKLGINLGVGVLMLGIVVAHVTCLDYYNALNITIRTWYPQESYWRQCYLPTFISATQTINPPKPKNYKVETAENLINEYSSLYDESDAATSSDRAAAEAQFEEEQPTVIAIMNETFSDLSIFENLHGDYQGPTYFKSLSDCLSRGTFYVSAFGGGTCNTEWEFLTGNSMANLGSGVYPYTIYDMVDKENLASQFKELGYTTVAMHPNHAENWNRTNVYADLGFDEYYSISDYEGADTLRGMVSDKGDYDKLLEVLNSTDDPQFIFNVTMQNHSSYNTGLIPTDKQVSVSIDGISYSNVNEYISLIQQSDEALEYLLDELNNLDKKVVVVFFGDHQPSLMTSFNDEWFTNDDEAEHQERLWQTDYIIWANYDVAGNSQTSEEDDLSANYLGAKLMQVIGAPMSDYQKAIMQLREYIPAINATGYEDSRKRWYLHNSKLAEDADAVAQKCDEALDDYAYMQYYQMFGDGSTIYTTHFQATANMTNPNGDPNEVTVDRQ